MADRRFLMRDSAAKEASAVASSATTAAETGGQVVGEVISTMDGITQSSKKIADIIGVIELVSHIASASLQQSWGIGQINQSVTHLDQMTQQNAALVEESAAAAESMADQAQNLAAAVSVFRLSLAESRQLANMHKQAE